MFIVAIIGVLVALALAVARAILGPTAFDKLLAVNTIGTFAIMLLALFGFLTGRPEFLDLGITYALLNMIGTLAVLKFFRYGWLGFDHRDGDTEGKG
ncbi:MAG: monovalent cation/H+ antiporter complex subunit F [Pseudomonadota bacterium]